ncbi:amidohydrolase family protein [Actinocrispum wychmicini]|uniref:Amidohydrolase-related domain-containing protein n=1 Tax=Actinocrispum wychmicini TaxID=1213861 RepID=A0A4R2J978_9PSEU|nr:amidohydrolase family protein [Actinocrispum wychmicini]TCO55861.1 hypothetical protein EV192_107284 [Actinocrispum wychmicini]
MTRVAVDVHTHLGETGTHVRAPLAEDEVRAWGSTKWNVTAAQHAEAAAAAENAIVLAFDAEPVGVVVDNEYVARAVTGKPQLIGFASVNPTRPDAPSRLAHAVENLGLRGLKLGPTYQHFHPHDRRCFELLDVAQHYRLPVIWHQGTTFTRAAVADYARPMQLDKVAAHFPELRMWIAHFGHPWTAEAVATIRRYEHFYLDVSAMDTRPWQLAQSLATASEYRVLDRVLFGTDYPFATVEATIAGLRRAAALCRNLGIADITDDDVDAICARDSLTLLGLGIRDPERSNVSKEDK